jgi:hypothetical protein
LIHDCRYLFFRKGSGRLLDSLAEMSVHCALHDDVEIEEIVEVAVNLDDVGVMEKELDLQLTD